MANDVQMATVLGDVLKAQLPEGWRVVQNYQTTGQARHEGPTVYFAKLPGERPVGTPGRLETWDAERGDFAHTHAQIFEATFRVQGFADTSAPGVQLSPADVLAMASMALQTDAAIAAFAAIGAQPLRIATLPAVPILNERDQWETIPTFDFVLAYSRAMVSRTPSASLGDVLIHPV